MEPDDQLWNIDDRYGSVAADHKRSLNDRFSKLPMLPSHSPETDDGFFSPVSVIRNVYVPSFTELSKPSRASRRRFGPRRRQKPLRLGPRVAPGAFSAVGHGYPHGLSTRAQCNAERANSRYNRLGESTFGFRSDKNAPSDCFRSTKRQIMRIFDRKSSE